MDGPEVRNQQGESERTPADQVCADAFAQALTGESDAQWKLSQRIAALEAFIHNKHTITLEHLELLRLKNFNEFPRFNVKVPPMKSESWKG